MSRHARTPLRRSVALAVLILGAVGCGIPTDEGPRAISRENVPDDVVDATTEETASRETVDAQIYLVQSPEDPRLVPVNRPTPVGNESAGPDPAAVLETLLRATPNGPERNQGITNLIPENTRLASQPELAGETLVVDLTRAISDVQGENQRAAFGQIVCTANELEGVGAVRFQVEGEPTDVQADSGSTGTDRPLTCADDYERLLADRD